jgi:hypothetical protein
MQGNNSRLYLQFIFTTSVFHSHLRETWAESGRAMAPSHGLRTVTFLPVESKSYVQRRSAAYEPPLPRQASVAWP